jgi:hypothetical protein
MPTPSTCISLESDSFALKGQRVNDLDWYEFDTRVNNVHFRQIGGEVRLRFIDNLITVLSNEQGITLEKIENAQFTEHVGGAKTEYLGYIVFSGYNTLYFFKQDGEVKHVVFADKDGKLLAHTQLAPELRANWLKELHSLRSGSSHA